MEHHRWVEGALVAAFSVAIIYWITWEKQEGFGIRKLIIMGVVTFIIAFLSDLLGDKIIDFFVSRT